MVTVVMVYSVCLAVGILYTVAIFLMGGLSDFSGHGGEGIPADYSHDYGVPGHGGHGEASSMGGDGGPLAFGPFSPLVIAFFLTCFGAVGLLMTKFTPLVVVSLPVAAASGFLLAWLLITGFNKLFRETHSSSEVRMNSLLGMDAEVTVAIPPTGVGEIAYVAMGSRNVAPARSDEQVIIPRFSAVRISRIVGNIFFVRPLAEHKHTPEADE